jgi:hypothetical protein
MRAQFEMCYMVTKFNKRMLRATGMPIRIFVCRKSCKKEKVPRKNWCLRDLNHMSNISSK